MQKQKLNESVLAYRNGDELALHDIFDVVNPMIERASREVEPFIEDFTKFDCRIVTKIKKLIDTYSEGQDFYSAVKAIISRDKAQYIRRDSRKRSEDLLLSAAEGDSEDDLGLQLEDPRESIEDHVLFKEKVTLLAQGNPKQKEILLQWSKGADDSSISKLLAQRYGGTFDGNRTLVKRFRTSCRNKLKNMA